MLRLIASRAMVLAAAAILLTVIPWILSGDAAESIRSGQVGAGLALPEIPNGIDLGPVHVGGIPGRLLGGIAALLGWLVTSILGSSMRLVGSVTWLIPMLAIAAILLVALLVSRTVTRRQRSYVRLRVIPYRTDDAGPSDVVALMEAIQNHLVERWWRRLLGGQPSVSLEVIFRKSPDSDVREATLAISCPEWASPAVRSAVVGCYAHATIEPETRAVRGGGYILRLKKRHEFIRRIQVLTGYDSYDTPVMDRILIVLSEAGGSAIVQLALTPTPALFDWWAARKYRSAEEAASEPGPFEDQARRPSRVDQRELEGGLDIQHRALFFTDIRIMATSRTVCERIGAALRANGGENRLVERGTYWRHSKLGLYRQRIERGEGNPLPGWRKGVFASTELATLWHVPSVAFSRVPLHRSNTPRMPAPPGAYRPREGRGMFRDEHGPVSIHPQLQMQNTKIVGTVGEGKTSTMVSAIAEDLQRDDECLILLDPKGDAADAALSQVPLDRRVTFLDLGRPMVGFNPMLVPGVAADTIADYIVEAMRNMFDEGDIKASSDRYLRNAIIAVKSYEKDDANLWQVQKLLSVTPQGDAYRRRIGEDLAHLPEIKEIVDFFRAELKTQLRDAGSTTTAKLDAPGNKLARFLNSPSIKRVLQERHEVLDFDQLIRGAEILIVKGALGITGIGNTGVMLQLLVGMLDAALARQQDDLDEAQRTNVSFNCDEAWLVFNRGFVATMALKRSAGLRTRAAWQTNAQWTDPHIARQLDALFGHHVWSSTASLEDARHAVGVMMADYTDSIRPNEDVRSQLRMTPDMIVNAAPHEQFVSAKSPRGRLQPWQVTTNILVVDQAVIRHHLERQWDRQERNGLPLGDWLDRTAEQARPSPEAEAAARKQLALGATVLAESFETPQDPAGHGEGVGLDNDVSGHAVDRTEAMHGRPPVTDKPREPSATPADDVVAVEAAPAVANATTGPDRPAADAASRAPAGGPMSAVEKTGDRAATDRRRRREASPESLNELAALDMVRGIRNSKRAAALPTRIEEAVLAGLANTRDRSLTITEIRSNWFGKRSSADAVRALGPAVESGWLRPVSIPSPDDSQGPPVEGYVLTNPGTRALAAAKATRRALRHTEFEILGFIAEMRVAFSTQIGRRWYPNVRETTLQRNLRKLFDAGLVDRFQFNLQGGFGSPACYTITEKGIEAVKAAIGPDGPYLDPASEAAACELKDPAARQARHDLHVSGWLLQLEATFEGRLRNLRGPQSTKLKPPRRRDRALGWITLGPDDVELPADDGAFLHSFHTSDGQGKQVPLEAFRPIDPDAAVELQPRGARRRELLLEMDLTERPAKQRGKFERYDHFLTGWWQELPRFAKHLGIPLVVFVCANEAQTLQFVATADRIVTARRAIPGQPASTWLYPTRERMLFVTEESIHAGDLDGYLLPALPIDVREQLSDGSRAGVAAARHCSPRRSSLPALLAGTPGRLD